MPKPNYMMKTLQDPNLTIHALHTPPKRRAMKSRTPLPREYMYQSPKAHITPRNPPQTKSNVSPTSNQGRLVKPFNILSEHITEK